MFLRENAPIISVTSLHIADGQRTFNSNFEVDVSADVIIRKGPGALELWNNESIFISGVANIKVVYSGGYSSSGVPYDLQFAVKKWSGKIYQDFSKLRHAVTSETIGENTITYETSEIPDEVKGILNKYEFP